MTECVTIGPNSCVEKVVEAERASMETTTVTDAESCCSFSSGMVTVVSVSVMEGVEADSARQMEAIASCAASAVLSSRTSSSRSSLSTPVPFDREEVLSTREADLGREEGESGTTGSVRVSLWLLLSKIADIFS